MTTKTHQWGKETTQWLPKIWRHHWNLLPSLFMNLPYASLWKGTVSMAEHYRGSPCSPKKHWCEPEAVLYSRPAHASQSQDRDQRRSSPSQDWVHIKLGLRKDLRSWSMLGHFWFHLINVLLKMSKSPSV